MALLPRRLKSRNQSTPWVLLILVAVNTAIFFLPNLLFFNLEGVAWRNAAENYCKTYGLVPNNISPLAIFTSMFIHGGVSHLLQNMYFLWLFGQRVEEKLGPLVFLLSYIVSGIMGALAHVLLYPHSDVPMIGASAAISGVMTLALVLFKAESLELVWFWELFSAEEKEDSFRMSSTAWILMWVISQLWVGILTRDSTSVLSVAVWAHIGGAFCGLILGAVFRMSEFASPDTVEADVPERPRKGTFDNIPGHLIQNALEQEVAQIAARNQATMASSKRYYIQKAGFGPRVLASLCDGAIVSVIIIIILCLYYSKGWPKYPFSNEIKLEMGTIAYFTAMAYTLPELMFGVSIGKYVLGLRIYATSCEAGSPKQLFIRWCVKRLSYALQVVTFIAVAIFSTLAAATSVAVGASPVEEGAFAALAQYFMIFFFIAGLGELLILAGFLIILFPGQSAMHDLVAGTDVFHLITEKDESEQAEAGSPSHPLSL